MREHVADIYFAPIKVNRDDQSIFVAGDVEYDEISHFVGRWKGTAQRRKTAKLTLPHDLNQRISGPSLSGCWSQNVRSALREITCIGIMYRKMRYDSRSHHLQRPNWSFLLLPLVPLTFLTAFANDARQNEQSPLIISGPDEENKGARDLISMYLTEFYALYRSIADFRY